MGSSWILHWNVGPEIFRLGPIAVRWYGLLFATGFYIGYRFLGKALAARGAPPEHLDRLLAYMVIGTLVGARLGHTLFYEPQIYLADPIRILKIWEGGLASHGASIGITLSLWLFARRYGYRLLWVLDHCCIPTAAAGCLIRVGNFFNSEIIGRPTNGSWGVVFDQVDPRPRHPTQLYEAGAYLLIYLILRRLYWTRPAARREGLIFGFFLVLIFGFRFAIEFMKENQVGFESSLPLGLNLGQWLSIPLVLIGIALMLRARKLPVPQDADDALRGTGKKARAART